MLSNYRLILILLLALLMLSCNKQDKNNNNNNNQLQNNSNNLPLVADTQKTRTNNKIKISNSKSPKITHYAILNTNKGKIKIGLYGDDAPNTVENFIGLSNKGYYNGILFHRVAKNFLIQTGDRNTINKRKRSVWGLGGESFFKHEFEDELNPNTLSYSIGYIPGIVAMANRGPNTNTSQFFICLDDAFKLEKKWTIFAKVIEGMNVVRDISNAPVEPSNRSKFDGIPLKPIKILSIKVRKK